MAEIRYGERWRLKSDPHCWRVQVIDGTEPDGSPHWHSVSYHLDLAPALRALRLRILRENDSVGMGNLDSLSAESDRITAELEDAVRRAEEVDA